MKALIFDAGPVISFASNNLLWLIEELKQRFNGEFYICGAAKREVIDRPLMTKRYEFEALQVMQILNNGALKIIENEKLKTKTFELLEHANNSFFAKNNPIRIVHYAEISGIVACLFLGTNSFVVDERTTRLLIENPEFLRDILRNKLHTKIDMNYDNIKKFRNQIKDIRVIRSTELVTIAYEMGLFDKYLSNIEKFTSKIDAPRKLLLESVLWGVKLNGCAVSEKEIDEIVRLEV